MIDLSPSDRTHIDRAAELLDAASRHTDQPGVAIYSLVAVEHLLAAGAQPHPAHALAPVDAAAAIRDALHTLSLLPAAQRARQNMLDALTAALRVHAATGEP